MEMDASFFINMRDCSVQQCKTTWLLNLLFLKELPPSQLSIWLDAKKKPLNIFTIYICSNIESTQSFGFSMINRLSLAVIFDLSLSNKYVHKLCSKLAISLCAMSFEIRACRGNVGSMLAPWRHAKRFLVTCSNCWAGLRCHKPVSTAKALLRNSLLGTVRPDNR